MTRRRGHAAKFPFFSKRETPLPDAGRWRGPTRRRAFEGSFARPREILRRFDDKHLRVLATITGRHVAQKRERAFEATRYHSLVVDRASLPDCLSVTAETADGLVMGVAHKELPMFGVQFHPESIASEHGHKLLGNFLALSRQFASA